MPLIKRGPSDPIPGAPTPAASGGLATQLRSGNASERWSAARAMGQDASAVPLLVQALQAEAAPEVRDAIFTSLVLIRTPAAASALAGVIRSDDAQLRTGALDALGEMPVVARPLLPDLLNDPDPDVRLLSCELVRPLDPQDGTDLLCALLEIEQHANVCGAAVDVLSETGTRSAADILARCALRFSGNDFLAFAIEDAIDRVSKRPARDA